MQDKTNYKINYNKSIKDKEKKILEYYKRKSNLEANKNQLPKLKKRTKKHLQNNYIKEKETETETYQKINDSTKSLKLTKTAKLPTPEPTKPKVVEMD